MGVQKRISQFGLKEQVSKGTAQTEPAYLVGLVSGTAYMADIQEAALDSTWSNRVNQGFDRTGVIPGADGEVVALPSSVGAFIKAVMGACSTTGAGPYVHTYSPSNTLTWWTLFASYGSTKTTIADAKADSFELTWDKSGAVKVKVKWMGITLTFASSWVIGAGLAEQIVVGPFRGAGGTFSAFGSTLRVVGGSIKVENKLEAIMSSASVTPADIFEAEINCTISLKAVPDDLNEFRRSYTGTTAGTTASSVPVVGAVAVQFNSGANTLQFTAPNVKFVAAMPDVDPNGGAAEITLAGETSDPGSGTDSFNFILTNTVATY